MKRNFLMESNIIIHHVGGRAGSMSFNIPSCFRNDFTVVLYEPDKDALERIEKYSQQYYGQHYVLPHCLDNKTSIKTLNINRDPNTSSLLKQNPKYKEYYHFQDGNRNYDYVWGETSETIIETEVNTTTLDRVIETEDIPSPDIFCIDTQGSEYNILEGSLKALTKTLAVIAEVEFSPLYINQPLFGDMCHFLQQYNFEFVYFNNLKEMSPMPVSIAARGKGFHMFADAVFIKPIEQIEIDFPDEHERKLAIIKLVFFLICSGYIEMAIKLMKTTDVIGLIKKDKKLLNTHYIKFCCEFYSVASAANHSKNTMPTFAETFTLDQSMQRSNATAGNLKTPIQNNNIFHIKLMLKNALKKITPLALLVHLFNNTINRIAELSFIWKNKKDTDIEKLFIDYKLYDIASLVKKNRLKCILGLYRNANK